MSSVIQNTGLERNTLDKFYTKSEIVELCITTIKEHLKIKKNDVIIEPSAGNGSFSKPLKDMFKNVIALDISPEDSSIIKQDFFDFDPKSYEGKIIHIIGNPPFGRQSSIAKKFIKKSATFADTISFVLPKSFKKESFQNVFPLHFHLITCIDLPTNSFKVNNSDYDVPCVFQIWKKKSNNRVIEDIEKPDFYDFVKKEDGPDLSFRRVGVNAGTISENVDDKSVQSHYFIKLKGVEVDDFIKIYKEYVKFDFDNTVGPKSISKKEFCKKMVSIKEFL
jgi:predicted RNA methylase